MGRLPAVSRPMSLLSKVAVLGLVLFVCGCQPEPKEGQKIAPLKLGTVDVMRVMEGKSETVQIRLDWSAQAGSTYLALADVADKVAYDALQKQIQQQSEAWQKRMDIYMEQSIAEVEVEASKLAKERGLDMVLVDNPLTKTLRYHNGEDLTTDIALRLQSGGK